MKERSVPVIFGWIAVIVVALGVVAYFGIWIWIPRDAADEMMVALGAEEGPPETHILPDKFTGWATVTYGVDGAPALPEEDGTLIHRYGRSGLLETSTPWSAGIRRKRYFYEAGGGPVELDRDGAKRRIWGESDIRFGEEDDEAGAERSSVFFVGTRPEYGNAPELPLIMLPDLELPGPEPREGKAVTVPVTLDHNRMLLDGEIRREDGTWRRVRLWVDSGNPELFISEDLAGDLGLDLSHAGEEEQALEIPPPPGMRIGGMELPLEGVTTKVMFQPRWLFDTMHIDANLPSTVLRNFRVVLDYPTGTLTLADSGSSMKRRGVRSDAQVHPETGIVQIEATIGGERYSFALDNGASYSFTSTDVLETISTGHDDWPRLVGAAGCANIWGQWPEEQRWPVVRVPEIRWGPAVLEDVGLAGLPDFFPGGIDVGDWYSHKTARPVHGFLGPNAFLGYRVEIDYAGEAVWFERVPGIDEPDMDLVGMTLSPVGDGWKVLGVVEKDGIPTVDGVEEGDLLLSVDGLETAGATMGTVVDSLRGEPGDVRTLVLERKGRRITVKTTVRRLL